MALDGFATGFFKVHWQDPISTLQCLASRPTLSLGVCSFDSTFLWPPVR